MRTNEKTEKTGKTGKTKGDAHDDVLSEPLSLPRGRELPNRVAKAAMSERLANDEGAPGPDLHRMYETWGRGGAGLLLTGNVMVDSRRIAEPGNVVLEDEKHLDAHRAWAESTGETPTWMQINHPGRQVPRPLSSRPVAPSEVPMEGLFGAFARPRELTHREIVEIVDRFANTAGLARRAGFEGVQIHGAHGYLVSQFLSPRTNRRTDQWGGTPEKRRRFLLEVVRAVRRKVGPDFPVGVKLNSADFQRGGFDEEESMAVVEILENEGVDLLEISGGTYESAAMFDQGEPESESTRRREAFFIDYAERVRGRTSLPLMVTGGFTTRAGMRDAVESGAVDLVGMARPFALAPHLPRELIDGRRARAPRVDLDSGFDRLDSFLQGSWYQAQLNRLGSGDSPDLEMSRLRAAVIYACR